MDPVTAIVMAVPAIVGLAFWTWYRVRSDARRTHRVLRKTRVSKIAELVDGKLACVVGTVELDDGAQLTSMLAHRTCVAYDTTIYVFHKTNPTITQRVDVERRLVPFFVSDGSGRIRIDAPEAALCNRPIVSDDRYEERIIEAGARVRIVGSIRIEHVLDDGERGYRDASGTTATLTGTAKWPILIDVERD